MKRIRSLLGIAAVLILAACGGTAPINIAANELLLTPADGATDVTINQVSVRFPAPLNADAINANHLVVQVDGVSVAGTISYDAPGSTLVFTPRDEFVGAALHNVTLAESVPFQAGERMDDRVSWSFTTAAKAPEDEPEEETPGNGDPVQVEFTVSGLSGEYDGLPKAITVTTDPAEVEYSVTYTQDGKEISSPIQAGDYAVLVEATEAGFTGSATATVVISPRALHVQPHDAIKSIGEDDPVLPYSIDGELVSGDSISGALSREAGETAGTYLITAGNLDAGPNYTVTFGDSAKLTISPFDASSVINVSLSMLQNQIQEALKRIATEHARDDSFWSFGQSGQYASEPTSWSVEADLAPVAAELQAVIDGLVCEPLQIADGTTVNLRIFTISAACGEHMPAGVELEPGRFISGAARGQGGNQKYALPFVIIADGIQGDYSRRVISRGEYHFVSGERSFARYALFTNTHSTIQHQIWFTEISFFDGPVHTNGHFAFYNDPWFGGAVTSAGVMPNGNIRPGAFFYDRPNILVAAADLEPHYRRGQNAPIFEAGVDLRADSIPLPEGNIDLEAIANENGLVVTGPVHRIALYTADETGHSPGTLQHILIETGPAEAPNSESYRITETGTLQRLSPSGTWLTFNSEFNGVIYAEQFIQRLEGPDRLTGNPLAAAPAIASYSQLTIVANQGVRITGHLRYEQPPCAGVPVRNQDRSVTPTLCDNLAAQNVLGILSPTDDILIGNDHADPELQAPNDLELHASLMASSGSIRVEGYQERGSFRVDRGIAYVLGGLIQDSYGAFGTFGGSGRRGYNRAFTYDPRFEAGMTPPYFPTLSTEAVTDAQAFTDVPLVGPWERSDGE